MRARTKLIDAVLPTFCRRREYEQLAEQPDDGFDTAEEADRGFIDGGTWEHRKRAREMLATADTASDLTALNHGKHHIAQYLPKAELDRFLKSAEARERAHATGRTRGEPENYYVFAKPYDTRSGQQEDLFYGSITRYCV